MDNRQVRIRNAHANNLKHIDIDIPKHCLVAFTGVSGSGKSSLLFDTIYTESQRQLIDTFSTFARARLPKLSRPDVDEIHNLSTPIVIDQRRMGKNLRSTVGTATELTTYLRLLYSRMGDPFLNLPSYVFSFNHPDGMCPVCHGLGKEVKVNVDRFLDLSKSIREGGIRQGWYQPGAYMWKELINYDIFDVDKPLGDFTPEELHKLLYSEPFPLDKTLTKLTYNRTFEGIARKLENAIISRGDDKNGEEDENAYNQFVEYRICSDCNGTRLNRRARSVMFYGRSIDELCRMELTDVLTFFRSIDYTDFPAMAIIRKIVMLLEQLVEIGVGYLSLERPVSTLSGGESQRVKMARQMDCDLTDLIYVLDEPTIGLHPRDTDNLIRIMKSLRDKGNTVYVVEHDPDVIRSAEWIVDMGPRAGSNGGEVVYNGPLEGLWSSGSLTAESLKNAHATACKRRTWNDFYEIRNASVNNLRNVSVRIPKGVLTCVTGVAGSGKSSLIHDCFAPEHPEAVVIDQSPVGRTSRGNVVTYIGVFDMIRKLFAEATSTEVSLFSFNSAGACPKCNGQGIISYDMHFLDAMTQRCDECDGRRYRPEVLTLTVDNRNISDVLDMTASQAMEFFDKKTILRRLELLQKVGLGYLKLGQSLSTLSGGELQRLKIASELSKTGNIYIMDEPTTGLHINDITTLCALIDRLVDAGNTVVVIEHNLDIISRADWVIDLGPEGGKSGGEVLFEGTPDDLVCSSRSHTARYLAKYLRTPGRP